jgi:hypothetical protein
MTRQSAGAAIGLTPDRSSRVTRIMTRVMMSASSMIPAETETDLTVDKLQAERERYRYRLEASGRYPADRALHGSRHRPGRPANPGLTLRVRPGPRARRHRSPAPGALRLTGARADQTVACQGLSRSPARQGLTRSSQPAGCIGRSRRRAALKHRTITWPATGCRRPYAGWVAAP